MQRSAAIAPRRVLRSRARVRRALRGEGNGGRPRARTLKRASFGREATLATFAISVVRRTYGSGTYAAYHCSPCRRAEVQRAPHGDSACSIHRMQRARHSAEPTKDERNRSIRYRVGAACPSRQRMAPAGLRRPTVTHQGEELIRVLNGTLATSWRANLRHQPYSYSAASLAQVKDQPARSGRCARATYGRATTPDSLESRHARGEATVHAQCTLACAQGDEQMHVRAHC